MGVHHSHAHGHDHGHGHNHGHGHSHGHAPSGDFGWAFAIGTLLNLGFVLIEGTWGFWTGSIALVADAGHNLIDVAGLVIAWIGSSLARRSPSARFTYGLSAASILAALANAVMLMAAIVVIAAESVRQFVDPAPVPGLTVMIVAGIGIVINLGTALLFARGRHGDINIRGAFLHMAADAAVSAGVVAAGAILLLTGAWWVDPLVGLVIAAVILWSGWGLFRESVAMALHGVPAGIDPVAVEAMLAAQPGVARVHDLHIWPMSTTEAALTAHLVMPDGHPGDDFLLALQHRLAHDHRIGHMTVQVETGTGTECRLHGGHR
ncbi:cation diffusion facilitator family transporter [Sphingomonas sp. FW199]|uniref:cation diffusion facilitator family transporter n=1 Tax=Sphingomonas sp. FW199 TaxID=3400217 RepID=UPI003CED104F